MSMSNEKRDIEVNVSDTVKISESLSIRNESCHLLNLHRANVTRILNESDLDKNDLIEVCVSLHIVLEVGINTFLRHILLSHTNKRLYGHEKIIENLDSIGFGDKVATFIYMSPFDFSDEERAAEAHKIINEIKKFSGMRNKLLHGHSISTLYEDGKTSKSTLSKDLNLNKLQEQILSFNKILNGLAFYFEHYTLGGFTDAGKKQLIDAYLDTTFLPITRFSSG